jgi:hypothetical protein
LYLQEEFYIVSVKNSNGGRTILLKEGAENKVEIEVTAENGATMVYMINVRRLSAKDAALSSLTTSTGEVVPSFSREKLEYFCKFAVTYCMILYAEFSYFLDKIVSHQVYVYDIHQPLPMVHTYAFML